jgi:hypothetical protein
MLMFAKIVDEETKRCIVGSGEDSEFYSSIGMTENDVEQAWNGLWYLSGYAPEKPKEVITKEEIAELQQYLNETDWYAVRYAETGVEIPEEVKQKRQEAREKISALREEKS